MEVYHLDVYMSSLLLLLMFRERWRGEGRKGREGQGGRRGPRVGEGKKEIILNHN